MLYALCAFLEMPNNAEKTEGINNKLSKNIQCSTKTLIYWNLITSVSSKMH